MTNRSICRGRQNLDEFIRRGVLTQDDRDCFYVYRQRMGQHQPDRTGGLCQC